MILSWSLTIKMLIAREILKCLSWLLSPLRGRFTEQVVILMYHRVTGDVGLELDVSTTDFDAQMNWLASTGRVISLDEAVRRVSTRDLCGCTWYVITFDDAYEDFYDCVLPLVLKHALPVTMYVPTGFLDDPSRPPISRSIRDASKLRPVTWLQLQEISTCTLVTIGSHTHSHREMTSLSDDEVLAEVQCCDESLALRLGVQVHHFAYPRGIWDERVEKILQGRYETVALVGGGSLLTSAFDPQRLPRVPILRSDGMRWFRARITGRLGLEEQLTRWTKSLLSRFACLGSRSS